jgi:hypothetical protein
LRLDRAIGRLPVIAAIPMPLKATTEAAAAIVKKGKRLFLWSIFFVWGSSIDLFRLDGPADAAPFGAAFRAAVFRTLQSSLHARKH